MRRLALSLLGLAALAAGCGAGTRPALVPGGDPGRGRALVVRYGCGSCHEIGGVQGADGRVGPSLHDFAALRYIAGELPNSPANAIRWIRDPKRVEPGTVMPDLGVTTAQARDIAAYLYGQ